MKEEEIRPQSIFDEYLQLCESDTQKYFDTVECINCKTLFVSPRPESAAFEKYFTESKSAEYWATTFYKHTAEARREKLWKPKAKMVCSAMDKFGAVDASVIDIGGGYGIFAEEYEKLTSSAVTIIEPGPSLANACRE